MRISYRWLLFAALALVVACGGYEPAAETEGVAEEAPAVEAEVPMNLPMTSESEEAKMQVAQGFHASDMARAPDARSHFQAAIEADPDFAFAHFGLAINANSLEAFRDGMKKAIELSEGASEGEQALFRAVEKGFANDADGQIEDFRLLVTLAPDSPRAKVFLAQALSGAGQQAEAVSTMNAVLADHPGFAAAHAALGNFYVFTEPRDFEMGLEHHRKAAELEPEEPQTHDGVGDALRAMNQLEEARAAYTRSAELDASNGQALQQRGHVNSFLGNWDEARADYDAAIALAEPSVQANYGTWRAFVSSYEGKTEDAIKELEELATKIDDMGLDAPLGPKIGALSQAALIAAHTGDEKTALALIEGCRGMMMEQAKLAGDDFKRRQLSQLAALEGHVAARGGDYDAAVAKAEEIMSLLEADANPRKNEPAHQLLGISLLLQGDHAGAIAELEQANPNSVYVEYHLGLAHEGAGHAEQAQRIFESVARNNFNSAAYSLVRNDAIARTSAGQGS